MKRAVSVCLLLALLLLSGCSQTREFTHQELILTLPEAFTDLSDQDYAQAADLLYGCGDLAILGIREDKQLLSEYGLSPTAEEYAQMVIDANGLSAALEETDGFCHFTYEASAEGVSCTYLTLVLEGDACFWTLQAYCPTESFAQNRDILWSCLTDARIDK